MTRPSKFLTRRKLLIGGGVSAGAAAVGGWETLARQRDGGPVIRSAEWLNYRVQRALIGNRLAREYGEEDITRLFYVNGTSRPDTAEWVHLFQGDFSDWRLKVDGLVERPQAFSLEQLRAMPSRTQITRHDCVEGWSAIAKWTGAPLVRVLEAVGPKSNARYAVFYCADQLEQTFDGSGTYYESIDMVDAFHSQTILAYGMNDQALPVGHGAPLRLRVERQLGYKQAKYLMQIQLVDSFADVWGGKGGYWEDRGYAWYAGI